MSSEDSDAVLLDRPTDLESDPQQPPPDPPQRPATLSRQSTAGIKKCWICMSESTEDDPNNPPVWRSPCSCSLQAHEGCLLDWIADLEDLKKKRKPSEPFRCPQCKSEIKVARPRSYIVDAYRTLDVAIGRLVLPGIGVSLMGTICAGAWVHGFQSVYLVFGEEDARRIWEFASANRSWQSAYALIPLNLIFARTNYADFVTPTGTLVLVSTQMTDRFDVDWTMWPPLPSTVFACLPVIRQVYNWCYKLAFNDLNRKWLKEIQPRREPVEGQENNIADEEVAGEGLVIELDINIGGNGAEVDANANADANEAGNAAGNRDDGIQGAEQAQEDNPNHNHNHNHVRNILGDQGDNIVGEHSSIFQDALGALAFPAVAASMGTLLSGIVPASWLSESNVINGRPGLFRTKWGRSVVGGCLFIIFKDALVLYCRWKLAQSHRQRKIMDYDKKAKTWTV